MKQYLVKAKKKWMKFVYILGEVNSKVIFTILFYLMFGIYAIITKIIKFFFRKASPDSFWIEKKYTDPDIEFLKRQF